MHSVTLKCQLKFKNYWNVKNHSQEYDNLLDNVNQFYSSFSGKEEIPFHGENSYIFKL